MCWMWICEDRSRARVLLPVFPFGFECWTVLQPRATGQRLGQGVLLSGVAV